jgi:predicted nucleic acid-binding protein
MGHLLDTSAVLSHFLDDPGADRVTHILSLGRRKVFLCAPSWAELERRLQELIPEANEAARVWRLYTQELCGFLPVDEDSVRAAIQLRRSASGRLPLIDALIAGCALARNLELVHRDGHMDLLSNPELRVLSLPAKFSPHAELVQKSRINS